MSNGTETNRIATILDSCRNDAKEQLAALQDLIENGDPRDIKAMATMAIAAENTARTVQKMCFLNLQGGGHGLAGSGV